MQNHDLLKLNFDIYTTQTGTTDIDRRLCALAGIEGWEEILFEQGNFCIGWTDGAGKKIHLYHPSQSMDAAYKILSDNGLTVSLEPNIDFSHQCRVFRKDIKSFMPQVDELLFDAYATPALAMSAAFVAYKIWELKNDNS